ncbi:MAG: thiamine-binding protein [Leuconostoc mesenteroides]|uniref:thiamine-binding protein n=1 Tax=Leuconostoc mesenteroides TaxID=1245 RepID=UPI001CC1011A|nr:thiamine-binding protein [Leuconostoc mesenteroides]MDN6081537.1 thiamine-binding protein [Leuconostoc sp.]MBZ1508001.1 thiamine-binding protein [Leuconostoc mesenteroides]MBZ1513166.1 thiamine-binding protein [Leuconostoc mesenteroides]MBZ1529355.1 thiamine-binding protein [Leuconostoc mesenteroides]MBZ1530877.1 thiamine-binding protein [Leuconostoc mesenteroides]
MISSIAVQVLPMTADTEEVIRIVDHVIAYIDKSGVNYQVGAFESTLEGDYDQLMDILKNLPKVAAEISDIPVMVYSKINMATDSEVLTIAKKTDKYK